MTAFLPSTPRPNFRRVGAPRWVGSLVVTSDVDVDVNADVDAHVHVDVDVIRGPRGWCWWTHADDSQMPPPAHIHVQGQSCLCVCREREKGRGWVRESKNKMKYLHLQIRDEGGGRSWMELTIRFSVSVFMRALTLGLVASNVMYCRICSTTCSALWYRFRS